MARPEGENVRRKTLALGALCLALTFQAGCKNSQESGPGESAGTPQAYPMPGLSFYSDAVYNEQIDDSYYFGGRMAVMYSLGAVSTAGRNAVQECIEIGNQRGRMRPVAYSMIGGYKQSWQSAGNQRYGRVQVSEGQSIGNISAWRDGGGTPVKMIRGGTHLVCVFDKNNRYSERSTGFFFEANGQMNQMINVNMSFSNYRYQFSEVYYGPGFKNRGGRPGSGPREVPAGRMNPGSRGQIR